MNLLEQLAAHLIFLGFAPVFWGRMPDEPSACLAVFSADSGLPGGTARAQILTRAETEGAAYETACRAARALDGFNGFLGGDGAAAKISVTEAAAGLGEDGRRRALYAVNITVMYGDEEETR